MAQGPKTLAYIVNSVLNELGDYSLRDYKRLFQLGIDGLRDSNLYYSDTGIKVVYLTMTNARFVNLPDDYVAYTKIGINLGGQIWTLGLNNDMVLSRKEECGVDINNLPTGGLGVNTPAGGYYFTPHVKDGEFIGAMYGAGGGYNASYFRIDKQNWRVQFSNVVPNKQIIMEYISDGIDADPVVPIQLIPVVKAYIHWKRIEYAEGVPMNDKMRKSELYYEEIEKVKHFNLTNTLSEYMDTLWRESKQTPKR